jgi:hypothetical protein
MHNIVPFNVVGNGLWKKREMGNEVRMTNVALKLWDWKCYGLREF